MAPVALTSQLSVNTKHPALQQSVTSPITSSTEQLSNDTSTTTSHVKTGASPQKTMNNNSALKFMSQSLPPAFAPRSYAAVSIESMKPTTTDNTAPNVTRIIRKLDTAPKSGAYCMFDKQGFDSDGFQQNKHDREREHNRERGRRRVVYGSKSTNDRRISDDYKCDIFVYHLPHRSTMGGLKGYLTDNGIDTNDIRIDITSHSMATYKSFRVIAPSHLHDQLFSPDFWPVDVRVKEYKQHMKEYKQQTMNRGMNRMPNFNNYRYGY